jgi:mono/diheme cytochrome c family protein
VRGSLRERSAPAAARGALALGLAVALAGCGGGTVARVSGPAVFADHCATCHSLSGHSAPKQQGGDLRNLRLPRQDLLQYSAEMPPVHGRLNGRELRAVVAYLQWVERR